MRSLPALVALALLGSGDVGLANGASGVVFVDHDRDGVRDADEPGSMGVAVSDGRRVTRTDADGRYALEGGGPFVHVTRPADYDCREWYRAGGGDFALVPRAPMEGGDELFFIHVSDAHVYAERNDFAEYSSPPIAWFIPDWLAPWLTFLVLENFYGPMHGGDIAPVFREALRPHFSGDDLEALSDRELMLAYQNEFGREGSALGDVASAARGAFAELSALGPDFIVNTGDLVLEGNRGSPEAMTRWLGFYSELAGSVDAPVYATIGNNEIGGTQNASWPSDDPRFGKGLYQRLLGPTHYSFDRGPFHFVALDTHRPRPGQDDPREWTFYEMDDAIREWARADITLHRDRVVVVLNHEPFVGDPDWHLTSQAQKADDAGLLGELGVPYTLTGHTHWRGYQERGATRHFTAGALSGMRWVLPPDLHERGYYLFQSHQGRLHAAWKRLHAPLVATAIPPSEEPGELIVAAADAAGPFARIEVTRAGRALRVERWGDYFVRVQLDGSEAGAETGAAEGDAGGDLSVRGVRSDGSVFEGSISVFEGSISAFNESVSAP